MFCNASRTDQICFCRIKLSLNRYVSRIKGLYDLHDHAFDYVKRCSLMNHYANAMCEISIEFVHGARSYLLMSEHIQIQDRDTSVFL